MGELQEKQGFISLPANAPSQAIVDVSENMRAKIYALFCKIGTCFTSTRIFPMATRHIILSLDMKVSSGLPAYKNICQLEQISLLQ